MLRSSRSVALGELGELIIIAYPAGQLVQAEVYLHYLPTRRRSLALRTNSNSALPTIATIAIGRPAKNRSTDRDHD